MLLNRALTQIAGLVLALGPLNVLNSPSRYAEEVNRPSTVPLTSISLAKEDLPKGSLNSIEGVKPLELASADDFWYPPFLIGRWKADFKFSSAEFSEGLPARELAKSGELPGFQKYSVFMIPNIGDDASCELRYVQIDSHPREDHPANLRRLVSAFSPSTIVDAAPYSYQRSSIFRHPSNTWKIQYHDEAGRGEVELLTRKRIIETSSGTVKTVEYFHQTHKRVENSGKKTEFKPVDYALQWDLSIPSARRSEFLNIDEIRNADALQASLSIFAFFQPSDELYMKYPSRPAAVFTYDVQMNRILPEDGDRRRDVESTLYPFVPLDAGPVELDQYFGF
eukprot:gene41508-50653_t